MHLVEMHVVEMHAVEHVCGWACTWLRVYLVEHVLGAPTSLFRHGYLQLLHAAKGLRSPYHFCCTQLQCQALPAIPRPLQLVHAMRPFVGIIQ